jgi:hypothetical protein
VQDDGRIDGEYTRGPLNPSVKRRWNRRNEIPSWRGDGKKGRRRGRRMRRMMEAEESGRRVYEYEGQR